MGVMSFGTVDASSEPDVRIVGGQDVPIGTYNFFASWDGSCGATVIHDDILLTAAHVSPQIELCGIACSFSVFRNALGSSTLFRSVSINSIFSHSSAIHLEMTTLSLAHTDVMGKSNHKGRQYDPSKNASSIHATMSTHGSSISCY